MPITGEDGADLTAGKWYPYQLYNYMKNNLKTNLIGNPFKVWSNSLLAQGTTGAQAAYEIAAAIYNEDAETADDSGNWVQTDCTMARTNVPGGGAGGSDFYYTITEVAATQRITRVLANLIVGHIYKCSIFIEDGTGTWAGAALSIMDNALANTIESQDLATSPAAWNDYSVIFKATEVNNQIVIDLALGGGLTALLDDIRVVEVGPGCLGADTLGPDTWTKTATLDLIRVQEDTAHHKGLYGCRVTKGVDTPEYLTWQGNLYDKIEYVIEFLGEDVAFGVWVYSVTASDNVLVEINDSDGTSQSDSGVHVAADTLTFVQIARTCGGTITHFRPRILFDGDTGDVAYISRPVLLFGKYIIEKNYYRPRHEDINLETVVHSNNYSAATVSANANINVEADSNARLPKGCKAVRAVLYGECANAEKGLYLQPSITSPIRSPILYSQVVNIINACMGRTACDSNGNIGITREDTFANVTISYIGVQISG